MRPDSGLILICDRDAAVRRVIAEHLYQEGFEVATFSEPARCLISALADTPAAIVLGLDGRAPPHAALLRACSGVAPVVILAPESSRDPALLGLSAGAHGIVTRVLHRAGLEALSLELQRALRHTRTVAERAYLHQLESDRDRRPDSLLFKFPNELEVVRTRNVIHISGEPGTGKRHWARSLHEHLHGPAAPLLHLDARDTAPDALVPLLWGDGHPGLLELGLGGTLHIGGLESAPDLTARLTAVIAAGTFQRLDDPLPRPLTTTLILSAHAPLAALADLPHLTVPPLRDRPREIAPLALDALAALRPSLTHRLRSITPAALVYLEAYPWPGNVRELRSVLHDVALRHRHAVALDAHHLPAELKLRSRQEPQRAASVAS